MIIKHIPDPFYTFFMCYFPPFPKVCFSRFIKHDVTEYIYLAGEIDNVLHFASPASPLDYLQLPIQTLKVGALGTHKALGLALTKQATFVLASTSEVYGDPLIHPQSEDYWGHVNPVGPRGVYPRRELGASTA